MGAFAAGQVLIVHFGELQAGKFAEVRDAVVRLIRKG